MVSKLNIATRASQLALYQAELVKNQLQKLYPHLNLQIKPFTTKGDQIINMSLAQFSKKEGKGLFVKELEIALLNGEADLAVHSLKDFPVQTNKNFKLAAILPRSKPNDSFLSEKYPTLSQMPENAIVGTTSLRRKMQVLSQYPHLKVENLRGNVNTRILKLKQGLYDAILLASAAIHRLKLNTVKYINILDEKDFIPAMGQGAIAVEILSNSTDINKLLKPLNDDLTFACTTAERAFVRGLNGGCQVPIGVYVKNIKDQFIARAVVGLPNGKKLICRTMSSTSHKHIAKYFHQEFIQAGAKLVLEEASQNHFV